MKEKRFSGVVAEPDGDGYVWLTVEREGGFSTINLGKASDPVAAAILKANGLDANAVPEEPAGDTG